MKTIKTMAAALVAVALCTAASAEERAQRVNLNIQPQPISKALMDLGEQAGLQVLVRGEDIRSDQALAPVVTGEHTIQTALDRILANSGLTYEFLNERTVRVSRAVKSTGDLESEGHSAGDRLNCSGVPADKLDSSASVGRTGLDAGNGCKSGNTQENLALARVEEGEPVQANDGEASLNSDLTPQNKIQEIVVTAQKRGDERLQDVPIPISVLSATSLLQNGATGLRDYFSKVPGVALVPGAGGANSVVIRGVSNNGVNDNPTVGISMDDAPYGPSTFLGGGINPIDMDPNELTQIEVLRGPQGTLYGASSLGGLLRYVFVDPSLDELSGRVSMSGQSSRNSDGLDYSVRASLNLPISSNLALRVSGFNREEAGYIDDTFSGKEGINSGHSYGGRAALLWRVNDDWSVKLSMVRQLLRMDANGSVDFDPSENEQLQSSDYMPNANGADRSVSFLTGTVKGRIGDIDFTSISAYSRSQSFQQEALTRGRFANFARNPSFGAPGADAGMWSVNLRDSKFSQELRADIPISDNIDWLVGAFYTEESGDYWEGISSGLRATGEELRSHYDIYNTRYPGPTYDEVAAFTNLTVRFTDRFDVQFGARLSQNRLVYSQILSGTLVGIGPGAAPLINSPIRTKDEPFTYLITPRFKLTDDWMVYTRVATGYRPPSQAFNSFITGGPPKLVADTTENYELGVKGELFDRRLSLDLSAYYIDWTDIPVGVRDPVSGLGYLLNAAGAVSKGVELSLELRPLQGLTLSAWGAWGNAYITELPTITTVTFKEGDRLPYSPRFSGRASIDYERPLFETMSGNMGVSVRYVGDRVMGIGFPPNELTAYTQVDANFGLKSGTWIVNAYINNVTDERGRIGFKVLNDALPATPLGIVIIRPRTIGLSISKDF